jgi:hypothetical protein
MMRGTPLGSQEYFVQNTDGQLRYIKVNIFSKGVNRLNSDRLGSFTNISKQQNTCYTVELVYDWPLDSYECELASEIHKWEDVRRQLWYPQSGRVDLAWDVILDLWFFWRGLAGATISKSVTSSAILLSSFAEQEFGGLVGSAIDAVLERAFEPVLKNALKIVNIQSPWALDITTGVATKLASGRITKLIAPGSDSRGPSSGVWPPPPEAVYKMDAALAFRRLIDEKSLAAFQFKWYPGQVFSSDGRKLSHPQPALSPGRP